MAESGLVIRSDNGTSLRYHAYFDPAEKGDDVASQSRPHAAVTVVNGSDAGCVYIDAPEL
jgi:hypothetical protein